MYESATFFLNGGLGGDDYMPSHQTCRQHGRGYWVAFSCRRFTQLTMPQMEPMQQESFRDKTTLNNLCLEGRLKDALGIVHQMHQHGIQPSIDSYSCLLQGCINHKALIEGKQIHALLVQDKLIPCTGLENQLVEMYSRCNQMEEAFHTFHEMVEHDVMSWEAIIAMFTKQRHAEVGFDHFSMMLKEGFTPSRAMYLNILKLCAISQNLQHGTHVHTYIMKGEQDVDAFIGTGLIDMYLNCGSIEDALNVFGRMPERGLVSWNMLICGCAKGGHYRLALDIFWDLLKKGERPNKVTFLGVLKASAGLGCINTAKEVHKLLMKYKLELVLYVSSALIDMYGKCGCPELGRQVFDKLSERNVVVWTSMISGYVDHGHYEEALKLFWQMEREGVCPNEITFVMALKACCSAPALPSGKRIHAHIRRMGLESDLVLQSSLVDMYAKCGSVEDALCVCDQMPVQASVLWNGMIASYVSSGHEKAALALFHEMEQRGVGTDEVTFVSVAKACANLRLIKLGKQIHMRIIETREISNRILNNSLVDMYHKCGDIDGAFKLFDDLVERDVISWNIIMAGHALSGDIEDAVALYRQMLQESVQPDGVTFLSLLAVCSSLGALELAKRFHACTIGGSYENAMSISNTLIDMYAKCGNIENALLVFDKLPSRTDVSWNVMILGCAQHGCGKEALKILESMQHGGVRLNHVTLVAIVSACSHSGLLADGCYYFTAMTQRYSITLTEEVMASIVDLFGRAGHLKAAKVLMNETGATVHAVVWKALLGACRIHGDMELAKHVAGCVLALEPDDPAAHVLWANISVETDKWLC